MEGERIIQGVEIYLKKEDKIKKLNHVNEICLLIEF